MMILSIRTDKTEAELHIHDSEKVLASKKWHAHRQLSDTIFTKFDELLDKSGVAIDNIAGIAVYAGPGSFTGLRIGHAFANSLSYAQGAPVVATKGEAWIQDAVTKLQHTPNNKIAQPIYGSEARTTKPRK